MTIKRTNLTKYLPILILIILLLIILIFWYRNYYTTFYREGQVGSQVGGQIGGQIGDQIGGQVGGQDTSMSSGLSSTDSNQVTKQVETLLRDFENNYRIFQEDNQRLSALINNGINTIDYASALDYLNQVSNRNNAFLQDLKSIRSLESSISNTYGQPLFASILEKVTQAENIINDSNSKIINLQNRILASQNKPTTIPAVNTPPLPTPMPSPSSMPTPMPTPLPMPSPTVSVPIATVPAVPAVTIEPPAVQVAVVTPPVVPVTPSVVQVTPPVPQVVEVPVPATAIVTPNTAAIVTPSGAAVVTDDSDIRALKVTVPTNPVSVTTPPGGWPNQIPILVPGQIVSQIPNPIVPSRFNNFAMESQAMTAAASTMGAVAVRPDRINCLSSMQYYAPISSPGYPPPQPVISGSY